MKYLVALISHNLITGFGITGSCLALGVFISGSIRYHVPGRLGVHLSLED
jgi:hypothetical protein